MSKNFSTMTTDEQAELVQKVAKALNDCDMGDVKPMIYREEVCQLTQSEVQGRTMLRCEKSLPASKKAQADRFNEAIKDFTEGVEGLSIKVNSVLGAGDPYQTIKGVTTLDDDQTPVDIEHTPGTVLFVDFWATWCPPCQKPMAHNQEMLTEHGDKWGDKVKIVGLSIDSDTATVKNHINNKGWTKPVHYWRSKSDCSEVYKVNGVPHVLLVDTNGKIVYKGHPAGRKDLVADFNTLLEGKELEGLEDGKKEEEEGDEEGGDKGTATLEDIKAIMDKMTQFHDNEGKALQTECKEQATGMMRNFCVLTLEASLDPKTGNWSKDHTNHRVLVGKQEAIDHCLGKIEEKMGKNEGELGWTFKLNVQTQAF